MMGPHEPDGSGSAAIARRDDSAGTALPPGRPRSSRLSPRTRGATYRAMRDTSDHSWPRAGDISPFAAALAEVRGGRRHEEAAGRLVGQLTDRERLGLLHGD